jgi:hypothetical protein
MPKHRSALAQNAERAVRIAFDEQIKISHVNLLKKHKPLSPTDVPIKMIPARPSPNGNAIAEQPSQRASSKVAAAL